MSENKAIIIERKIEFSKLRLWLIWLLLFVFPSITAIATFNYIKNEYYYFAQTEQINKAFNDIKKYNDLIAPESFMEEQIKEINKLNTNKEQNKLKKEIDNLLLGETLFCIFFNDNASQAKIIKKPNSNNIPLAFIKKHIKELIENINKENDKTSYAKVEKIQEELGLKLQLFFKTVTPITISLNKISKNYSIAYNGELYFLFSKFERNNKESSYIFAVIKGQDFSYTKMVEKLQKRFPQIKIVFNFAEKNKTLKLKKY